MAATTAYETYSSIQATKEQQEIEQKMWESDNEAKRKDYAQKDAQLTEQENQVNAKAAKEQNELNRAIRAEQSRMRTASGEAGVGGVLSERLERNLDVTQSLEASTIESNRTNKIQQAQYEKRTEALKDTPSQLWQAGDNSTGKWIGAGLKIAGETINTYSGSQSGSKGSSGSFGSKMGSKSGNRST